MLSCAMSWVVAEQKISFLPIRYLCLFTDPNDMNNSHRLLEDLKNNWHNQTYINSKFQLFINLELTITLAKNHLKPYLQTIFPQLNWNAWSDSQSNQNQPILFQVQIDNTHLPLVFTTYREQYKSDVPYTIDTFTNDLDGHQLVDTNIVEIKANNTRLRLLWRHETAEHALEYINKCFQSPIKLAKPEEQGFFGRLWSGCAQGICSRPKPQFDVELSGTDAKKLAIQFIKADDCIVKYNKKRYYVNVAETVKNLGADKDEVVVGNGDDVDAIKALIKEAKALLTPNDAGYYVGLV